jgi:hypothetical protein
MNTDFKEITMTFTEADRCDALSNLRCAGYSANSHPAKPDCVVVNDPVYVSGGQGCIRIDYEHRTLRIDRVWDFIDQRS